MTPTAPPSELETSLARHGGFVRALARRLLRDDSEADDVAQQTCLAALQARPEVGLGLGAWLARVARNFAFRKRRDEARRERRESLVARPEAVTPLAPADLLQRQQAIRDVVDAVMDLPEPYRSAVVLRYYEDLEPVEIAARLGVPAATIRTRLHRGLEKIRRRLDVDYGGDRASWTAAILPVASAGQGWVAAAAGAGAGAGAAAGGALWTSITLGGLVMAKKALAAGVVVAVIAVSVVVFRERGGPDHRPAQVPVIPEAPAPSPGPPSAVEAAAKPSPAAITPAPFVDRERAVPAAAGAAPVPAEFARLLGRIVDEEGRPLAGVPVTLDLARVTRKGHDLLADTVRDSGRTITTGDDGRFAFSDVPVGLEAAVRARPTKLCDAFRKAEAVRPGEVDLGDLVAAAGGAIEGRVLGPDGEPVADARVSAMPVSTEARQGPAVFFLGGQLSEVRTEVTSAAGNYRIEGLAEGTWRVEAVAEGRPKGAQDGVRVRRREVTGGVELRLAVGARIEGIVRDSAGAPVAGARVSASPSELKVDPLHPLVEHVLKTTSGPDGRFVVEGLDAAAYNVSAAKAGFASRTAAQVVPGATLVLELPPCALVHGEVRSTKDRTLIEHFEISVSYAEFGPGRRNTGRVLKGAEAADHLGVAAAPGLFAVTDLQDGEVILRAKAPGFADRELEPITLAGGARERRDLDLDPELTVSGRILGPDGVPVAAATVSLAVKDGDTGAPPPGPSGRRRALRFRSDERRVSGSGPGPRPPLLGDRGVRSVPSGADGSFQIGGVGPGEFVLSATHRDHANGAPADVVLTPGNPAAGLELRLRAGGIVQGRVFDESGKPMPGAQVAARMKTAPEEEDAGAYAGAISDAQGRYEITGLLPGAWLAKVEDAPQASGNMVIKVEGSDDHEDAAEIPVVIEAGRTTSVDLRMPPKGTIAGMVTEGGKPVPGAKVWITAEDSPLPLGAPTMATDERGVFEFKRIGIGTWLVNVTPPGGTLPVTRKIDVVAAREYTADIPLPTGAIEGRVLDAVTGEPVAGVILDVEKSAKPGESREVRAVMIAVNVDDAGDTTAQTISFSTGDAPPVTTDSRGRYAIRYLEAGDYDVGLKGGGMLREKKVRIHVAPDDVTRGVDFAAKKGSTLAVTIEDAPGFAIVTLFKAGEDEPLDTKAANTSSPFRFDGLAPGRYRVDAHAPPTDARGTKEVDVPPTSDIEISVRCQARN